MLSKAKHPCTGFLTAFGMTPTCHAEQSEAPTLDSFARTGKVNPCAIRLIRVFRVLWLYGFLAYARNDTVGFVMLSEAKHPRTGLLTAFGMTPTCHAEQSAASMHWIPHWRSESHRLVMLSKAQHPHWIPHWRSE